MPVTARLSKLFYDRFGDQVVDELVGWFNSVDATYRNDLREMNELNFARFDAKLEQRLAELRGELVAQFERRLGEQLRWLVAIWITVVVAAVGLWMRR